ncbi:MAG: MalY/PatB family protein [Thermovirgaceae bacterium]
MAYSFDRIIDRRNTDSLKWDAMESRFGPVPRDTLPMWVADMDFLSPGPVLEALGKRLEHGVFGYSSNPRSAFEAVADWMERIHGWSVAPDWVFPAPGVMPAIGTAIRAFSDPGDQVVIMPPVYPPFYRIVEDNNRVLAPVPLTEENGVYRMDMKALEKTCSDARTKMILLCSPHNPVGRVWRAEELDAVAEISGKTGTLVVSDEIHADLVHSGNRHITYGLRAGGSKGWITCVSPSKTFNIPGLNTSYTIIADDALRAAYGKSHRATAATHHNVFGLAAAKAAYSFGDPWRREMLAYVEQNLQQAIAFFQISMPWVGVTRPDGTYLLWLDFRKSGLDSEKITEGLLKKGRVALDPGHWFGKEGEGFQRLNVACPGELLEDGLRRIRSAFADIRPEVE